jgi:hypothetical protein
MTVRMICDIRSRFVQAMKQAGIKASKLTFKNLILACQQAGLQDQALNIKVIPMSAILDHTIMEQVKPQAPCNARNTGVKTTNSGRCWNPIKLHMVFSDDSTPWSWNVLFSTLVSRQGWLLDHCDVSGRCGLV